MDSAYYQAIVNTDPESARKWHWITVIAFILCVGGIYYVRWGLFAQDKISFLKMTWICVSFFAMLVSVAISARIIRSREESDERRGFEVKDEHETK